MGGLSALGGWAFAAAGKLPLAPTVVFRQSLVRSKDVTRPVGPKARYCVVLCPPKAAIFRGALFCGHDSSYNAILVRAPWLGLENSKMATPRVTSRYPRPGERVAPNTLREFLMEPIPRQLQRRAADAKIKLCDLDESAWERFPAEAIVELSKIIVDRVPRGDRGG